MLRLDPDLWAGALLTLLCLATGMPVLILQLSGEDPTAGPPWVWWLVFAGFIVTLITSMMLSDQPTGWRLRASFAAQVVLGATVVLLSAQAGWTPILLIVTSTLSAYVVERSGTMVVVAANTAVIGIAAGLAGNGATGVVLTAGVYLLLQGVSVLGVISEQRHKTARLQLAQAHTELRATTALLEASSRTAERLRISRDLHDVIGHQVTALALELEVASHHAQPPADEHVGRARSIAKDLLADLRATVGAMRDTGPELAAALEAMTADLPTPRIHLQVREEARVDEDRRTTVVRCVQEIITNAIRHAHADNLWIDVTVDGDGALVLSAHDDGRGTRDLALGNGLTGMRERVEGLGGRATFSAPAGFCVVATVPAP